MSPFSPARLSLSEPPSAPCPADPFPGPISPRGLVPKSSAAQLSVHPPSGTGKVARIVDPARFGGRSLQLWANENHPYTAPLTPRPFVDFVAPVWHWLCQCKSRCLGFLRFRCDVRVHWQSQCHPFTELNGKPSSFFIGTASALLAMRGPARLAGPARSPLDVAPLPAATALIHPDCRRKMYHSLERRSGCI